MLEAPRDRERFGDDGQIVPVLVERGANLQGTDLVGQPRLGGRAAHILGPGTFRPLADVELDAVTLTQIVESLAVHRTLMKEILLPGIVLDEPKSLVDS